MCPYGDSIWIKGVNINIYVYTHAYIYIKVLRKYQRTFLTLRVGEILLNQDAKITKMVNLTTSKFKTFIYQKIPQSQNISKNWKKIFAT